MDPLIGLKENVIIGKHIPAGTGMRKYRDIRLDSDRELEDELILDEELEDEFAEGEETDVEELEDESGLGYEDSDDEDGMSSEDEADLAEEEAFEELIE